MEQYINIIICLLTVAANVVISLIQNRKSIALVEYRLKQLEEKQDKHNCLIDRTYKLEQDVAVIKEDLKNGQVKN